METKELNEYEEKEREISERIISSSIINKKKFPSILELFPEIKDNLKYPYSNWIHTEKVYVQIPFYNQLLVDIIPIKTEHEFMDFYGLSPKQIIELSNKNKINLYLGDAPHRYANIEYMDDFLEIGLPSQLRKTILSNYYSGNSLQAFREYGGQHFLKLESILGPLIKGKFRLETQEYISQLAYAYSHLCSFGFDNLANHILKEEDVFIKAFLLELYFELVVGPFFDSLDGIQTIDDKRYYLMKEIYNSKGKHIEMFPTDVGKQLTMELPLVQVNNLDDSLEIYNDYRKAKEALFSLNQLLENKLDEVPDKVKTLEVIWKEIFEEIEKKKTRFKKVFEILGITGTSLGSLGLYELTGIPGFLSSIIGGFSSIRVVSNYFSEKISMLGKNKHIVALYKLKKELN